jgi:hypothetical protein
LTSFLISFCRDFDYFIGLIVALILAYFGIYYFVSIAFYSGFYYLATRDGFSTILGIDLINLGCSIVLFLIYFSCFGIGYDKAGF